MSQCKGCNKPIKWVTMYGSDKKMPLDPEPVKVVCIEGEKGILRTGHIPHWATCPNAKLFGSPGRGDRGG